MILDSSNCPDLAIAPAYLALVLKQIALFILEYSFRHWYKSKHFMFVDSDFQKWRFQTMFCSLDAQNQRIARLEVQLPRWVAVDIHVVISWHAKQIHVGMVILVNRVVCWNNGTLHKPMQLHRHNYEHNYTVSGIVCFIVGILLDW